MKSTLIDISTKIERHKADALAAIDRTAKKAGIPFFVVGGAARDFILEYFYGIRPSRVTHDVDVGANVASWDEFTVLVEKLMAEEHFKKTNIEHRFLAPSQPETMIDILPFGPIEGKNRIIKWKQDNRDMNMAGFSEAYKVAVMVKISSDPPLSIKTVTLAGLALLKLISWNDNPDERDRDAKDFRMIMHHYNEACSMEYVFEEHGDISSGEDYELVIARILGRDIKKVAGQEILSLVIEILNRESDREGPLRFIQDMQAPASQGDSTIPRDIELLNAVAKGVAD
jgi:predicted nucleotidyltransferase